jgi:hypothetical protein
VRQVGYAVQLNLQRDGDLLFHLFGGMAGPLRNDLDVRIGDVWIGFDGKAVKRNDSPDKEDDSKTQHQDAIVQGQVDQVTDHRACPFDPQNSVTASRLGMKLFYREAESARSTQRSCPRDISIAPIRQ